MKKYTVSLSFQCNEDWTQMTPMDQGRHCKACDKVVIDFSTMTDSDIIQYLLKNKNTCGRFQPNQLNKTYTIHLYKRRSNWPAIAGMLIAGLVTVSPTSISAAHKNYNSIEYHPVDGKKGKKKVEPDKTRSQFILHLLDDSTNNKILFGNIYVHDMGSYFADNNGDISIENIVGKTNTSKVIHITISAPGYESKVYTLQLRDLNNATSANIYLTAYSPDHIMPAGAVVVHEN